MWEMIGWHIWGVISVSISVVLITLNLTQVDIDGEIGRSPAETTNIIAGLQVLVQMHGLSVTASLVQIARQWIHGSLLSLDRGIPLALVGAERDLGLPSFVISRGYLAAVKYSVSLWWGPRTGEEVRRKWDIGMLTTFLFVSCILSVFAAPASSALMVPRIHLILDATSNSPYGYQNYQTYPHIIVPEEVGDLNEGVVDHRSYSDPFRTPTPSVQFNYWDQIYPRYRGLQYPLPPETHTQHQIPREQQMRYINTTTTWGRSRNDDPGGSSTYAKAIMEQEPDMATQSLYQQGNQPGHFPAGYLADYDMAMHRWSQRLYVTINATAIVAQVNCRYRRRVPCPPSMDTTVAPWCLDGSATLNQRLMLFSRLSLLTGKAANPGEAVSTAYITEGDRSKTHPKFFESLQIVFDHVGKQGDIISYFGNGTKGLMIPTPNVTVCSISTVLTPAVLSELTIPITGKNVDCPYGVNRTLQYHEHWLDYTSIVTGLTSSGSRNHTTIPPRTMVELVANPTLRDFGDVVLRMYSIMEGAPSQDPAWLELMIAGTFTSLFSTMSRSSSQYTVGSGIELPESAILEPPVYSHGEKRLIVNTYKQGYGFKLSSRVGILAVVLFILHGLIVLVGLVWQLFWGRGVIRAWSTVPEYLALGLGSTLQNGVLENTCAGITSLQSLQTIVNVGVTTPEHLELHVGVNHLKPALTQFDAKYGSRAKGRQGRRKGLKSSG